MSGIEVEILTRLRSGRLDALSDDARLDYESLTDSLENQNDEIIELDEAESRILSQEIESLLIGGTDKISSTELAEDVELVDAIYTYNSAIFPHIRFYEQGAVLFKTDIVSTVIKDVNLDEIDGDDYILITPW